MESDQRIKYKLAHMITTLRNVYPDMTVQLAHVFFLVSLHEGKTITDLEKITNYPLSSLSRKIRDLGDINRKREPGLGLVELKADPMDYRRNLIHLTSKGSALMNDLMMIWRS